MLPRAVRAAQLGWQHAEIDGRMSCSPLVLATRFYRRCPVFRDFPVKLNITSDYRNIT